jgi:hypothetical protein
MDAASSQCSDCSCRPYQAEDLFHSEHALLDAGRSGTPDCKRFLKPFGGCWKRRFRRRKRSDFTPKSSRQQSLANLAEVNVNDRKQVIYKHPACTEKVEKASQLSYTVCVVDSQKIPTNRHVHQGIQAQKSVLRAREHRGLETWRNEPAEYRRRGIVFAASRCAGRDGAGTLRAAALLAVPAVKE